MVHSAHPLLWKRKQNNANKNKEFASHTVQSQCQNPECHQKQFCHHTAAKRIPIPKVDAAEGYTWQFFSCELSPNFQKFRGCFNTLNRHIPACIYYLTIVWLILGQHLSSYKSWLLIPDISELISHSNPFVAFTWVTSSPASKSFFPDTF